MLLVRAMLFGEIFRIVETLTVASGSALTSIVCPADKQPLVPGGVLTCTGDPYKVTKTDLARGRIEKSAVAVGKPPVSPGGEVCCAKTSLGRSQSVYSVWRCRITASSWCLPIRFYRLSPTRSHESAEQYAALVSV